MSTMGLTDMRCMTTKPNKFNQKDHEKILNMFVIKQNVVFNPFPLLSVAYCGDDCRQSGFQISL